jgi:hypothetical protein
MKINWLAVMVIVGGAYACLVIVAVKLIAALMR